MLALNIIRKSPEDLLHPLDFYQVAPILFLQLEKIFSWIIPNTELGLRLLPLIAFLISLYLFLKILAQYHANTYVLIFCISLFAFNSPLLYYSSEVKQYMTDVLVLSAMYFILLKPYSNRENQFVILCVAGPICIFLSNVSPVILFSVGAYLVYQYFFEERKFFLQILILFLVWLTSFSIYYALFIYKHPSKEQMITYWGNLQVFAPRNPLGKEFYFFLGDKWSMITHYLFQFGGITSKFLSILFIIGTYCLIKEKKAGLLLLVFLPILLHLLLSSFKLYPFDVRLLLYTIPLFILVFSFGFKKMVDMLFTDLKIQRFRILALLIPIWLFSALLANGFYTAQLPFKKEELKKNLVYISNHKHSNDGVYVYCAAIHQFNYYRDIKLFTIDQKSIRVGQYYPENDKYVEEILALKGSQWLVFSHSGSDEQYIVSKLVDLGYKLEDQYKDVGSGSFLFDFKNETK